LCTMHFALEQLPAHAISTKNKHLLEIYPIPARGFTAALSVFGGTPPPKPLELNCKSRLRVSGGLPGWSWTYHTGDAFDCVFAKLILPPEDITWMSRYSYSQIVNLSPIATRFVSFSRKTKNPAYISVSRVGENLFRLFTCLRPAYPDCRWSFDLSASWTAQGSTYGPGYTGNDVSRYSSGPGSPANSWQIC
jgi:hypothetical protein